MCSVRDVFCGGEDAEKVEESAVGRRERGERRIMERVRKCIVPRYSWIVCKYGNDTFGYDTYSYCRRFLFSIPYTERHTYGVASGIHSRSWIHTRSGIHIRSGIHLE